MYCGKTTDQTRSNLVEILDPKWFCGFKVILFVLIQFWIFDDYIFGSDFFGDATFGTIVTHIFGATMLKKKLKNVLGSIMTPFLVIGLKPELQVGCMVLGIGIGLLVLSKW